MKKTLFLSLLSILLILPPQAHSYDKWDKLGRGGSNVIFGYVSELYHHIHSRVEAGGRWPVATLAGALHGLAAGTGRTFVGAFEVLTFPIETPEGYRPILEPHQFQDRAYPRAQDWPDYGDV